MARFGGMLGMEVLAWSQNLTEAAAATRVSKQELLRRSDVVTIHTKLSDRTRDLFAATDLALMKPTAFITPHLGYVVEQNYRAIYGDTLEDIEAFLDGRVLRPLNTPRA